MKLYNKLIKFVLIVLLHSNNFLYAQNIHIYNNNDTACLIPDLCMKEGNVTNVSGNLYGNAFSGYHTGLRVYGIGIIPFTKSDTAQSHYVHLISINDNNYIMRDSLCIDTTPPTAFVRVPIRFSDNDISCQSIDTILPVIELFFDSCHVIEDSIFATCVASTKRYKPYNFDNSKMLAFRVVDNYSTAFMVTIENSIYRQFYTESYGESSHYYGIFPILDSTLRHPRPCGDVYGLQSEYTALRQHTLSWSATTPHSLYQVAYGPTDADTDDYSVIETTDTFCTVTSPGLCERYAFRVRARCCNYAYDTNESWRPWSDTVHFLRPCNTVTLFSNDSSWGSVFGSGRYECDSSANIEAIPEPGFLFSVWSDGDSNSMRTLTLSGDTTLTAFFAAPAGIDETASEAGITLSPNPASGSVQILSASPILSAELLSLDGRQILHNSASNATSSHSLSLQLDSVPAGVYIVSVLTTLGHAHLKLVVR